jgi:hypothetical protein
MSKEQKDNFWNLEQDIRRSLKRAGVYMSELETEILKYDLAKVALTNNDEEYLNAIDAMLLEYA